MTCFYCSKKGLFAANCFKKILDVKNKNLDLNHFVNKNIIGTSKITSIDNTIEWFLDSGASMHMTSESNYFTKYVLLSKEKIIEMSDRNIHKGIAIGDVKIHYSNNSEGILRNLIHVPSLNRNIISISKITNMGFFCLF